MKKSLLYILIHFSSAVIADWITVEHDYNMCDQVVPSKYASFHIDDDGNTYSTSLLIRNVQTIKHEPPLTTLNITMWGCTNDCSFSFMMKINRTNISVSSYTEKDQNNYKCKLSNYTMKIIPTPKITYKKEIPNPDHVFPTDLTAKYCSEGKHPDAPSFQINQTEHIAECIDYLTGNEVGTYATSLQFGSGSSFSPDEYGVATYHMINSANKLFNYWDSHHQGFHDALEELSIKMTPENLKELIPPPPPPPKKPLLKIILISVAVGVALIALPTVGYYLGAAMFSEVVATTSEIASEIGAAEDVLATSAEGSAESIAAEGFVEEAAADPANVEAFNVYEGAEEIAEEGGAGEASCPLEDCPAASIFRMASYFDRIGGEDFLDYFVDESELRKRNKRDTVPMKFGFYTANMMNSYFLPSLMNNVHQSFTGSGQTYPDISSYLSAASEHLQFHFEDTLHNNFFAGNKSILASFTVNTIAKKNKRLDNIYNSIKNSTYNTMAATIISATLRKFNVEICDTKPSFCGEPCGNSGHIYCPIVGNDTNSCVITATDNQVKELKYLREPFDICSKANGTGWNLTHNSNCDRNQFQCK